MLWSIVAQEWALTLDTPLIKSLFSQLLNRTQFTCTTQLIPGTTADVRGTMISAVFSMQGLGVFLSTVTVYTLLMLQFIPLGLVWREFLTYC